MELDALKSGWRKDQTISGENEKYIDRLPLILKGRTTDMIFSLKRKYERTITIMFGSMMMITLLMPFLTDGFTYPGSAYGFAKLMFFYQILLVFYWMKWNVISRVTLSDSIKDRMEQMLILFRKSFWIETSFILVFSLAVLLIGRFFYGKGMFELDDIGILTGLFISIGFMIAMLILVRRRYANKMRELKVYLNEYKQAQSY
jgi:hypothetical protein